MHNERLCPLVTWWSPKVPREITVSTGKHNDTLRAFPPEVRCLSGEIFASSALQDKMCLLLKLLWFWTAEQDLREKQSHPRVYRNCIHTKRTHLLTAAQVKTWSTPSVSESPRQASEVTVVNTVTGGGRCLFLKTSYTTAILHGQHFCETGTCGYW